MTDTTYATLAAIYRESIRANPDIRAIQTMALEAIAPKPAMARDDMEASDDY